MNATPYQAGQLARRFALDLQGAPEIEVSGAATLQRAGPQHLSLAVSTRYVAELRTSRAGLVIVPPELAAEAPCPALIALDPQLSFAKIAVLFERTLHPAPGIHPSAVVAPTAQIDSSASIGPCCVIEDHAVIEAGAILGPNCVIGPDCIVGQDCRLVAQVTLVLRVSLGKRVLIQPGAVIGGDGFGLAFEAGHWVKIPQLGGVQIGDDCEIGANTAIDRGALEDTVLEEDVRLDNLIHIAHNVKIGAHTVMAGQMGVAGSAKIGRYCRFGARAGVFGHLEIVDQVTLTGCAVATHDVPAPGEYTSNNLPLQPTREWLRNSSRFKQLDQLARRVSMLEKDCNHD